MLLTAEVQIEYVRRYRSPTGDSSPIHASEFVAPHGFFVIGHDDGEPVAMGGWRRHGDDGVGELKRMYVREAFRGRGISRLLLAELERSALGSGIRRLVLETGVEQPEAIGLYRSSGYVEVPAFGYYAGHDDSVHLGKDLRAS